MKLLPTTATDAEMIRYIDDWVSKLEAEDYNAAIAMVEYESDWTGDLLRRVIKSYGDALPSQRATLAAKRTDVSQRKKVDRWDAAPDGALGDVWYDLGIDGFTSDLTATFRILPRPGGIVFRLNDVHVM